jgi:hypothetical protein
MQVALSRSSSACIGILGLVTAPACQLMQVIADSWHGPQIFEHALFPACLLCDISCTMDHCRTYMTQLLYVGLF